MTTVFECGDCRNNSVVIRAVPDQVIAGRYGWDVMCGRGHRVAPEPDVEFTITEDPPE